MFLIIMLRYEVYTSIVNIVGIKFYLKHPHKHQQERAEGEKDSFFLVIFFLLLLRTHVLSSPYHICQALSSFVQYHAAQVSVSSRNITSGVLWSATAPRGLVFYSVLCSHHFQKKIS